MGCDCGHASSCQVTPGPSRLLSPLCAWQQGCDPRVDQSVSLHPHAHIPASSILGELYPASHRADVLCRLQELGSQASLKPLLDGLCSMRSRTFLKMMSEDGKETALVGFIPSLSSLGCPQPSSVILRCLCRSWSQPVKVLFFRDLNLWSPRKIKPVSHILYPKGKAHPHIPLPCNSPAAEQTLTHVGTGRGQQLLPGHSRGEGPAPSPRPPGLFPLPRCPGRWMRTILWQ